MTTELGGKNVFIPSTIVVTAGHPVKLSIFNTTDVPHGFAIPALNVAEVLPAKAEHEIELRCSRAISCSRSPAICTRRTARPRSWCCPRKGEH